MEDASPSIFALDAAYKPFPAYAVWASKTSVERERWDRYKKSLEQSSECSPEQLKRAREIAKRAAAVDTGAIEGLYEANRGFTFTVAFETATWELALAEKGEQVPSLFAAQLDAYDYVLDLATKAEPISEAAIRVLHEIVCRAQETYRVNTAIGPQEQPLPKGKYKILPNHVRARDQTNHSYAPVDATPSEMQRLVSELRSPAFLDAHPALQAAYAHYSLVVVHPFADGNGRVARALASVFAYRATSTPIIILSEQKGAYLDSLEAADRDEYQAFVDFILDRLLDTIQLVDESIRSALAPNPESVLEQINKLYFTKGGYTEEAIDGIGQKLLFIVEQELSKIIPKHTSARVKGGVSTAVGFSQHHPSRQRIPNPQTKPKEEESSSLARTHRALLNAGKHLVVNFQTVNPAHSSVSDMYDVLLPRNAESTDDVVIRGSDGKDTFSARIEEIVSPNSGILQIRASMFAERIIGRVLARLSSSAESVIKASR